MALFSQGKYDRALEAIKPDVEANPDWEFGHRLIGLCYVQLGQNSLAVASLSKALQLKSEVFSTYQGLSQAYFNLGKYSNAAEVLLVGESFVKSAEDRYYLHHLRGSANLRLKKYSEAAADFTNAIKQNNASFLDYSQLGAAYLGLNSYAEAISALEKALQMQPGHPATLEYLGRAYESGGAESLRAKDYATAVQRLTKAREMKPTSGSIHYNLGSAFLFQDRFKAAEESLLKAGTILTDNAKIFERLGYLYEKSKALDKALAAYQKAAALNPSQENKESVERVLKRKSQSS